MNKPQFNEIHELIKHSIQRSGCNARQPVDTEIKLAVCLRSVLHLFITNRYYFFRKYTYTIIINNVVHCEGTFSKFWKYVGSASDSCVDEMLAGVL